MPCDSYGYCGPTAREIEARRVASLLQEVNGEAYDHKTIASLLVGDSDLDVKTERLCEYCRQIDATDDIAKFSLELQIWWRDHRALDAQREEKARVDSLRESVRQNALAKLTPAERKALGL